MTPVLFGLLGPIIVIFCLVMAVSTCDLYTFHPRPQEVQDMRERWAAQNNNGVVLDKFPGGAAYYDRLQANSQKMAETLRRATDQPVTNAQPSHKRVSWR